MQGDTLLPQSYELPLVTLCTAYLRDKSTNKRYCHHFFSLGYAVPHDPRKHMVLV